MILRPSFRASFHVEFADGIYLLSERSHSVLRGRLYRRLAPLLDGRLTSDEIVDRLRGEASAAEVYYALDALERKGYIGEADDGAIPADRVRYWQAHGLHASEAEHRLHQSRVELVALGDIQVDAFSSAIIALGMQHGANAELQVVLTDDYLREGLSDFNAAALASGRPWLIAKPVGTVLWIGPVFRPGLTGCWECMAQRLRANRVVEAYLQHVQKRAAPVPVPSAALPSTVLIAANLIAGEAASALLFNAPASPSATITTMDLLTLESNKHTLVRRPQCAKCGSPQSAVKRQAVPIVLESGRKRFTADGGHRTVTPDETLERFAHHVSPISGAVSVLERSPVTDAGRSQHVYISRAALPLAAGRMPLIERRILCSGKGWSDTQARASALCEALERYSGIFQGDEIRRRATYRDLGDLAIHPNTCMGFSDAQYAQRSKSNANRSRLFQVPEPFDEAAEIEWAPVWSLSAGVFRYLPVEYLYYGYQSGVKPSYCPANSNGCAAGNTLEEAVLQGFMELVERDSVALWWYNRIQRPAVDLNSFDDPYIHALLQGYSTFNLDVCVLDLSSDLDIPVFAAVLRRTDPRDWLLPGFGAHFDARIGIMRALTELNQYIGMGGVHRGERKAPTAAIPDQPYLQPSPGPPRRRADYAVESSSDLRDDVLRCRAIVERAGMEMLVLDQTRPDIGLPVVKVIVPGLRHFWPRFGPGRLYDIPVELGWLSQPTAEDALNPLPLFP
jgi:ribosomal protein S12 methylthiotransferase accessory factor